MPPIVAAVFVMAGILGLFLLDRDKRVRTSFALCLPVLWLLISTSRPVSLWFQSPSESQSPSQYLEGNPLNQQVLSVLLIASAAVLVGRRRQLAASLRANGPLLLFFIFCALSTLWSDYPSVAFKRWVRAAGDLAMVGVVVTDPAGGSAIKRLIGWTAFIMLPMSILFIRYYPDLGRYYSRWEGTQFVRGVAEDKNMLGMLCLVVGIGTVWRFLGIWRDQHDVLRTRKLTAHGAVLAMVLWLLWQANSMTSLSCFLIGSSLIVVVSVTRRPAIIHSCVAILIAVSITALFFNAGGGLLNTLGRDPTLTGRTQVWKDVLSLAGSPLVGTGFESFWLGKRLEVMWNLHWWHPNEAHNGYLELFLNLGWIGITLFSVMLVIGYRDVVAALRRDGDVAWLKLAYFVVAIVYNFTEAAIRGMSPVWIFFLLAIVSVPNGANTAKKRRVTLPLTFDTEPLRELA